MRGQLTGLAVNLGVPGPDTAFGAGRVRVNMDAPRLGAIEPASLSSVRGQGHGPVQGAVAAPGSRSGRCASTATPAVRRAQTYPQAASAVDTRRLPDGWHALSVQAKDFSGNVGGQRLVDQGGQHPPAAGGARGAARQGAAGARPGRGAGARRPARGRLLVAVADAGTTGTLATTVDMRTSSGRSVSLRTIRLKPGPLRAISLGRLGPGRYRVRLDLRDRAGNPAIVSRTVRVR